MSIECNRDHIERHIELLTQPWKDANLSANTEIRCLNGNGKSKSYLFNPSDDDETDDAVSNLLRLNEVNWNCYICVNPINPTHVGCAADDNIVDAYYQFADADTEASAKSIRAFTTQPNFYVITGKTPFERLHAYWMVDGIKDVDAWKLAQKLLIQRFDSDKNIKNPSRIMRLAGTVSWPNAQKLKRGYIPELTALQEIEAW